MGTSGEYDEKRSDEKHLDEKAPGAIEVSVDDVDTGAAVAASGDMELDPLEAVRLRCGVRLQTCHYAPWLTETLPTERRSTAISFP
jgi:hypothetical protein